MLQHFANPLQTKEKYFWEQKLDATKCRTNSNRLLNANKICHFNTNFIKIIFKTERYFLFPTYSPTSPLTVSRFSCSPQLGQIQEKGWAIQCQSRLPGPLVRVVIRKCVLRDPWQLGRSKDAPWPPWRSNAPDDRNEGACPSSREPLNEKKLCNIDLLANKRQNLNSFLHRHKYKDSRSNWCTPR